MESCIFLSRSYVHYCMCQFFRIITLLYYVVLVRTTSYYGRNLKKTNESISRP